MTLKNYVMVSNLYRKVCRQEVGGAFSSLPSSLLPPSFFGPLFVPNTKFLANMGAYTQNFWGTFMHGSPPLKKSQLNTNVHGSINHDDANNNGDDDYDDDDDDDISLYILDTFFH